MSALTVEERLNRVEAFIEGWERIINIAPNAAEAANAIAKIQVFVASFYNIKAQDITGPTRTAWIVTARWIAIYLAYDLVTNCYSELGRAFGDRDHASILYAVAQMRNRMELDPKLKARLEIFRIDLTRILKPEDKPC